MSVQVLKVQLWLILKVFFWRQLLTISLILLTAIKSFSGTQYCLIFSPTCRPYLIWIQNTQKQKKKKTTRWSCSFELTFWRTPLFMGTTNVFTLGKQCNLCLLVAAWSFKSLKWALISVLEYLDFYCWHNSWLQVRVQSPFFLVALVVLGPLWHLENTACCLLTNLLLCWKRTVLARFSSGTEMMYKDKHDQNTWTNNVGLWIKISLYKRAKIGWRKLKRNLKQIANMCMAT